jgi:PTS system ascorbate-specific IIC component
MKVLNFIQEFMQQPSLFIGLIGLIGFILLRERIERTISGTLKIIIGLLMLTAGVNLMVPAISPLGDLASKALKLPPLNIQIGTNKVIAELGAAVGMVMLLSFLVNLLIARFTRLKYIYLTGHLIFWNAVIYTTAFKYILKLDGVTLVLVSSLFTGLYQTLQPWATHKFDLYVNDNNNFVLGHDSSIVVIVTSLLSKLFSQNGTKKAKSMEELTFPKALSWLREPMLLMASSFLILYIVVSLANYGAVSEMASKAGHSPAIWILLQSFNFAVGFAVLMQGVRMFIAELIPAFKGIAEKVVPGALPAVDCPLFFPYGQVSMAYGGLIGMAAMVVTSLIFGGFKYPFFIFAPTMSAWFHGATGAVYGNKYWGIPGAILGGIVAGVLMGVGQALMWPVLGFAIGDFFSWASDTDYVLIPLLIVVIGKIFVK